MRLPSGDKLAVSLNSFEPGHGLPIGGVTARPFELCFEVSNVDEAVGELIGHAGSVLAAPRDMPWGERVAYVADPDGNPVHIRGPLAAAALRGRADAEAAA